MTKREIIVRLWLTFIIIATPILWFLSRYLDYVVSFTNRIRNIWLGGYKVTEKGKDKKAKKEKLAETTTVEKNATPEPTPEKKEILAPTVSQEQTPAELATPTTEEEIKEEGEKKLSDREIKQLEMIKFAALSYKERGKMDQYEKKLIEGLAFDTDNVELLQMLGEHYFNTGNLIKALSLLKKVIHVMPDNHKVVWQIGQIYLSQDDKDTAKLLIEKAIKLKPDNPKYHISLVEIYYEQAELKPAIRSMEKILKLRPTNIDYLLTIATLHEEAAEPTKATEYYSKIIELDPMNEMAKKGLKRLSR